METCYKVFRRDIIQSINLKSNRFGIEPEITAKVATPRLLAADGRYQVSSCCSRNSRDSDYLVVAPLGFVLATWV